MSVLPIKYIEHWATEYVTDTVTADVDLGTQDVFMAVIPYPGVDVTDPDWHPVDWLADESTPIYAPNGVTIVGYSRGIRINVGPDTGDVDPGVGDYGVLRWIKDISEKPGKKVCLLRIT